MARCACSPRPPPGRSTRRSTTRANTGGSSPWSMTGWSRSAKSPVPTAWWPNVAGNRHRGDGADPRRCRVIGRAGGDGGWLDRWRAAVVDRSGLGVPVFLLAISLSAVLASSAHANRPVLSMLILGVVFIPDVAWPVRLQVLSLQHRDFVIAAMALGGSRLHVVRRRLLPQVGATLLHSRRPYSPLTSSRRPRSRCWAWASSHPPPVGAR